MDYKVVKARCLFCEAQVERNQREMAGVWEHPKDDSPRWLCDESKKGRDWLWYLYCDGDNSPQDFYLCPIHNTPRYFHAAISWVVGSSDTKRRYDFTAGRCTKVFSTKWVKGWKQAERIGNLKLNSQAFGYKTCKNLPHLPDRWQANDPRVEYWLNNGFLSLSISNIEEANPDTIPNLFQRANLVRPLELVKAMKKWVKMVETVTEQ